MAWFKRKESSTHVAEINATEVVISTPQSTYVPPSDNRTNICPNCGTELKKVPGAKTKCPNCGRYMYVRTDPRINARVVLGDNQVEEVDDAIAVANGTWEQRQVEKLHRAHVTATLTQKFGVVPSDADVNWRMWNEDFLTASGTQDTSMMFSVSWKMTEQLMREKRYPDAVVIAARGIIMNWADFDHEVLPAWTECVDKAIASGVSLAEARGLFEKGAAAVAFIPKYRVDVDTVWNDVVAMLND